MADYKYVVIKLKQRLEEEGFNLSSSNPVFVLMNPSLKPSTPPIEPDDSFFINLPNPPYVPADVTFANIDVSEHGIIYFALTIVFCSVLDGLVEDDDINNVYDKHAAEWSVKLDIYFQELEAEFGLTWDVVYDECIEDSLYRWFSYESVETIIELLKNVRRTLNASGNLLRR